MVVYATVPVAAVVGFFTVDRIEQLPLRQLWRLVRDIAGVTRTEFLDYFHGTSNGVGIFIADVKRLDNPVPLEKLRTFWPGFHPPQGFRYLNSEALDFLRSVSSKHRIAA